MLVRFRKNPPGAPADHLACLRDDGAPLHATDLPRAGVLPVLAVRFVIETTLGWADGWFGSVARDGRPDDTTDTARQSRILSDLLQAEQWSGPTPPDAFRQKLAGACSADHGLAPPPLSDDQLAALRAALRAFGAVWRPLGPGQTHEVCRADDAPGSNSAKARRT